MIAVTIVLGVGCQ